jgi:adenine-specific DNA methylase
MPREPRRAFAAPFPAEEVSYLALCEGNAKKPVYTMHKWWARRLGVIFRMLLISLASGEGTTEDELWQRFYSPFSLPDGFTVLDPFLGGGTTLVEAAKQGARCIGCDIDPVACFITTQELTPTDPEALRSRVCEIEEAVAPRIRRLYRSWADGRPVDAVYFFWVDRISCPSCGAERDGHPTYQLAHDRQKDWQMVVCPFCDMLTELRLSAKRLHCGGCRQRTDLRSPPMEYGKFCCPDCGERTPLHQLYRERLARPRLFAKEYLTADEQRGFARIGEADLRRYAEAEALLEAESPTLPIPSARIPEEGRSDRRPLLYGYSAYREMFNARQLYCLGLIAAEIQRTKDIGVRQALALGFSHCLASNNMFCGYAFGYRRLTPLFSVHAFRKISRPVEGHVWGLPLGRGSFSNAMRAVIEGKEYMRQPYEYRYRNREPKRVFVGPPVKPSDGQPAAGADVQILNQTSADLSAIPSGSVDLILTDPPYFDNLSYSELSDFYHVWLREILRAAYPGHAQEHTPMMLSLYAGECIPGPNSAIPSARVPYLETLTQVFQECRRVAKAGAGMVFTYHHRSPEAWAPLGQALLQSGFRVLRVFPVRSEGRSGFHSYGGSIKWDSVLLCRREASVTLRDATGRAVGGILRSASSAAKRWEERLRRAKLEIGATDLQSLRMSLVIHGFSQRGLRPTRLQEALEKAAAGPRPAAVANQ